MAAAGSHIDASREAPRFAVPHRVADLTLAAAILGLQDLTLRALAPVMPP